ncbi:MAG: glycine zipper family protein [Acidiferrobacterales bacterium]
MSAIRRTSHYILFILLLAGCTNTVPLHYYDTQRYDRYPVLVVPARFDPKISSHFAIKGKGQGALVGAGVGAVDGIMECIGAARGGGDFAGLAALVCIPFGAIIGATIGGVSGARAAEEKAVIEKAVARLAAALEQLKTQTTLTNKVIDYSRHNDILVHLSLDAIGPKSINNKPDYSQLADSDYPTILELSLIEVKIRSSGAKTLPLCLSMKVSARQIDSRSGIEKNRITYRHRAGCVAFNRMIADEGKSFSKLINDAYEKVAEEIVDDFFLLYYPKQAIDKSKVKQSIGLVPEFVLKPVYPPIGKKFIDFKSVFFKKPKNFTGYGGMHFVDIDTLRPRFQWEAFPRQVDLRQVGLRENPFSNITYDLRLYRGMMSGKVNSVAPIDLVYSTQGLKNNHHQITKPLQPCSWYYWTVKARFKLEGVTRSTDWGGAYNDITGGYFPSAYRRKSQSKLVPWPTDYLYYSFRTAASQRHPGCWESISAMREALRSDPTKAIDLAPDSK